MEGDPKCYGLGSGFRFGVYGLGGISRVCALKSGPDTAMKQIFPSGISSVHALNSGPQRAMKQMFPSAISCRLEQRSRESFEIDHSCQHFPCYALNSGPESSGTDHSVGHSTCISREQRSRDSYETDHSVRHSVRHFQCLRLEQRSRESQERI